MRQSRIGSETGTREFWREGIQKKTPDDFDFTFASMKFVLLCFILLLTKVESGLKWVKVKVPRYQLPGETATLECDYNLGNFTLYSVKWYKDNEEFYRFVPKARPQVIWYEVEGVQVDISKSDSRKVKLHSVNWKTTGSYKCEVSAEAPSFASAESESKMEIIILPEDDPVITRVEIQYGIGDEINLNCTSGKSRPPPVLHWFINEQQIQKKEALIHYDSMQHSQGLLSSTLGLKFRLGEQHFRGGSMKVKCVASIAPILYRGEWESEVQTQKLPLTEMREALLLVRSLSNRRTFGKIFAVFLLILTYTIS